MEIPILGGDIGNSKKPEGNVQKLVRYMNGCFKTPAALYRAKRRNRKELSVSFERRG